MLAEPAQELMTLRPLAELPAEEFHQAATVLSASFRQPELLASTGKWGIPGTSSGCTTGGVAFSSQALRPLE